MVGRGGAGRGGRPVRAPPRAAADCGAHPPLLGAPPLPFAPGPDARRPDSRPAPCPCNGPNCHKVPSEPAPPPSAPPTYSHSQDLAWLPSRAPSPAAGAARPAGDPLLAPLFSPAPLERPPPLIPRNPRR